MRTDVLVIGGGLAGCATAYYLAREGVEVALLERHDLNTQASGSNAGSIHAQIPHEPFRLNGEAWARTFAPTIPLMVEFDPPLVDLGRGAGRGPRGLPPGRAPGRRDRAQMREIERKAAIERAAGLPIEILGRAELRALAPYVAEGMIGGAFCPVEGKANPLLATPAFARAAQRHGARLLRRTELRGLERERDGFVAATGAAPIRARRVVDCAGAEAGEVARMVGIELPVEGHPIQVSVTEATAPLVRHLLYFAGEKLTLKQTRLGALLIGGGWPARRDPASGRPVTDPRSLAANLRVAQRVVPAVGGVRLLRTWPAIVNGTADWKPIIGEVPGVPGFYLAMFPWMGFTAGPIAAKLTAQLLLGREPDHDITPFRADRYF